MQIIYTHAAFALLAVPLGLYVLLTKKGTKQHRILGRIWVTFLIIVSLTAIFIQAISHITSIISSCKVLEDIGYGRTGTRKIIRETIHFICKWKSWTEYLYYS